MEPLPRISLTHPKTLSPSVKPSPMPKPSKTDGTGLFFDAKLSALARIMQLTVIRGIKSPSASEIEGKNAFKSISIILTNAAITTIYDAILILFGIKFLIIEITK